MLPAALPKPDLVIAEEYPEGFSDKDLPAKDPAQLVAVAALVHSARQRRAARANHVKRLTV